MQTFERVMLACLQESLWHALQLPLGTLAWCAAPLGTTGTTLGLCRRRTPSTTTFLSVVIFAESCFLLFFSLEHHLQIHARAHSGSEAPPNSPTFPTTTIRETPISSLEDRNVLRSESPTASRAQRSDVSSLPPEQRPPPYTSTQAPAELVHLRQLLLDATTHLVWLAASAARQLSVQPDMSLMSFMRQANLALIAPVSDVDVDFLRRLAVDFPTSLASATDMSFSDIARILLPVYERWLLQARNAQYD